MFESLSDRLQAVFQRLGTRTRITEEDVTEAMREVRVALLEADVNFSVVKVRRRVQERPSLVGAEAQRSLNPAQAIISLVNDALIDLLGRERVPLAIASPPPTIIMLVGLQGSGKTTHAAKLARTSARSGQNPVMVVARTFTAPPPSSSCRRSASSSDIARLSGSGRRPAGGDRPQRR